MLWKEVKVKNNKYLHADGTVLLCVKYSKCNRMLKYNIWLNKGDLERNTRLQTSEYPWEIKDQIKEKRKLRTRW
jgi:hypothetical protein